MNTDPKDKTKEEDDSDLTNPYYEDEENDWSDEGDLDLSRDTEDNWLGGLDRVVKRKEKHYEN